MQTMTSIRQIQPIDALIFLFEDLTEIQKMLRPARPEAGPQKVKINKVFRITQQFLSEYYHVDTRFRINPGEIIETGVTDRDLDYVIEPVKNEIQKRLMSGGMQSWPKEESCEERSQL